MATRSSLTMGAIMLIGNRYETRALLGEGGMGSVYRAYDRLTRQEVALKRVTTPPDTLLFNSRTDSEDLRVALAQEFRIMAGLRHPNIVSVLDYGFETDGAPYFTMTLLEGAQPFLKAAADRTLEQQVQMLIELLQALAYLHRRGVFHRDLKPSNILVDKTAAVRVLDFGLSQTQEEAANADDRIVGTPAYLAPELLEEGGGFSTASDLHAVGVIAYQMLTGKHPYEADTLPLTLSRILTHIPDLSGLPEAVQPVITRLLAKDPAHRYQSATAVIAALEGALGIDTRERAEIRESFLQASRFVGRDDELKTLRQALDQARGGQGAAWLIGGESGVGKSRLLDEIRIRAMTSGITVLQGQGVSGSGQPFQLWRDPMRRLALRSDLSLFEAGVLKEIVPDIDDLLGQTVPKAPQVDARFAVPRLVQTILEVLRRQQAPVMLILEDLQWAEESLEPLRVLNRFAHAYPWLLLGSYRSDERPTLPDDLPGMQTIMLSRLDQQAIAELSVSMIGQRGLEPKVLQFIERETEGNAFFMVEVVRALAEEAGRLSEIGSATLPARVVAGGIQRIIERRLGRVPAEYHAALEKVAVAGREIDRAVLPHLTDDADAFLLACGEAAVLEVAKETWRFAHDKLREAVIARIEDKAGRHKQVALALEAVYPDDPSRAQVLVEHWHAAGDHARERTYAQRAAEYLYALGQFAPSDAYFERALNLSPDTGQRAALLTGRGKVAYRVLKFDEAETYFTQALGLLPADSPLRVQALNGLSIAHHQRGAFGPARKAADEALTLARTQTDQAGEAAALRNIGMVLDFQGQMDDARTYHQAAVDLYKSIDDQYGYAASLNNLSIAHAMLGDEHKAVDAMVESLTIAKAIGAKVIAATIAANVGSLLLNHFADFDRASVYFNEGLAMAQELGDRYSIALSLIGLGDIKSYRENYTEGDVLYLQALEQIEEADLPYYLAVIRQKLTDSYRYQLRLDEAREQNQLGTALCREKNFVSSLVEALRTAVLIALASDRTQDALPPLREAIQHAAGLGDAQQLDCVAAGAAWAISQQNYTAAAEWLGRAREGSKHPHHTREFARWEKTITQALGPAQTRAALQRGQAMSTQAAFAAVRAAVE